MRIFTGVWAYLAVVLSVLLLATLSRRPWGFATLACGVVLIVVSVYPHFRVPTWAAALGMVLSAGAAAAGLAVTRTHICCMFGVVERRGYPFGWLVRSADYMDLPGRVPPPSFADEAPWRVDTGYLLADLALWGVLGVTLMVACSVVVGVVVRQAGRVGLLGIRRGSSLDSGNA